MLGTRVVANVLKNKNNITINTRSTARRQEKNPPNHKNAVFLVVTIRTPTWMQDELQTLFDASNSSR